MIPKIVITDADGLAENTEPALVVLHIDRKDIDSGCTGSVMERLLTLTDTPRNINFYRGCLTFQVDGFNEDPRELQEIPEVREFFVKLTAEWPFWPWFIAPRMGSMALLMSLLCPVTLIRGPDGQIGVDFLSPGVLLDTLKSLYQRMLPLLIGYGVTEQVLMDQWRVLTQEFFGDLAN